MIVIYALKRKIILERDCGVLYGIKHGRDYRVDDEKEDAMNGCDFNRGVDSYLKAAAAALESFRNWRMDGRRNGCCTLSGDYTERGLLIGAPYKFDFNGST